MKDLERIGRLCLLVDRLLEIDVSSAGTKRGWLSFGHTNEEY